MSRPSMSRRSLIIGAAGVAAARSSTAQTTAARSASAGSFDIDRFVDAVKRAAASDGQPAVEDVLRRALSEPNRVLARLGAEVGIHTIHTDGDLTILNVVWAPLMVLVPHNHNMWASIGIYTGREDNIVWERRGQRIAARGAASLSAKDVFGLPVDAIHSVTNPIGRPTGAIHIYGGDFFAPGRSEWNAETLHERPWDLAAVRGEFRKAAERFNAVPQ